MEDCDNCHECLKNKKIMLGTIEVSVTTSVMIVCPICGNKRCPKATDHRLDCTDSNEPNQVGSIYQNKMS